MIFDKIDPFVFFVSFGLGLMYCYITNPSPKVVLKFPSPYNTEKVIYHETGGDGCYKYKADKVGCPTDKSLIKPQPIND